MKLNKFLLVSIFLLAIISLGAASAADTAADDLAVGESGDAILAAPADEIDADGAVAVGNDVNGDENSNLCATDTGALGDPVSPKGTVAVDNLPYSGGAYTVQWGQSIIVSGTYENSTEGLPTPTGTVTLTFADITYEDIPLVGGKFTYEITKYSKVAQNQKITVLYTGDDNYTSLSQQLSVHVRLDDVVPNGANYGQIAFITVNLHNATGNVSFTLNGKTYNQTLVNGTVIQEFTDYKLGSNSVSFSYSGDENYNAISKSVSFSTTADIDAPTIYNLEPAIIKVHLADATGYVNFTFNGTTESVPIVKGVATYEAKNYTIGTNNQVNVVYSGDDTFNSFSTSKKFTVLDKENATILSSVYKTATKNMVVIAIPFATGNVSAIINGKEETLELINGIAYYDIAEGQEIYEINVTYAGNARLNPANSTEFAYLTNNVVNNDNYMYYFNQRDAGKVFEFIEDGSTLDFQGSILNPDQNKNVWFNVNKPLNIISTTNDAYIDLNTTAGSLLGENPGNRFTVSYGGSWSNITGINFHNTQLWVFNTHHVVLDRVSNVIEDQRVGSGVGATSIRANSTWVTVKNSYFYTRNNGGSSSLVIAWADYCTFDNNTIVVDGNVGNMIYLTTYNVEIPTGVLPNVYNNITNNRILAHDKTPAAICWGLVISGANNYVANNYIDYGGVGINQQWGQGDFINNTYTGNVLVGASANFLPTSIVYNNTIGSTASTGADTVFFNNTVAKALTVGANAEAYDNTVGALTLSGANAIVHDNIITGSAASTISQGNIQVYNNTFNGDRTLTLSSGNAKNVVIANNTIVGSVVFNNKNAVNAQIVNNTIITSGNYAVDLKTYTGTAATIVDNVLSSAKGYGDDTINHKADTTLTIDNYQNETAEISVAVDPIKVGQTAVFNVTASNSALTKVAILVNNKRYDVDLVDGKGSVEVSGLLSGDYNVIALSVDKIYAAENSTVLPVTKNECPEIAVDAPDKTQWIASNITVTIPDATGKVTLNISGTELTEELVDGVAVFEVPDFVPGEYNFTIAYEGDYKYFSGNTNGTLNVVRNKEVYLIVSNITADKVLYEFTAQLIDYIGQPIAGATVEITVDGKTYYPITDDNGDATANFILTRGIYPVDVVFEGIPGEYDACVASANIAIIDKTFITIVAVSGDFNVTGVLTDALGAPIANAVVKYTVNGGEEISLTTDENGTFVMAAQDDCTVEVTFEGDDISLPSNANITLKNIKPVRQATEIEVDPEFTRYANDFNAGERGSMFYFVLKDGDGNIMANKSAKIGINGVIYSVVTDSEGKAGLQINLAKSTAYTYAIAYLGDDEYNASFAVSKLNLVKKPITITPKKTSYTFTASAKNKYVEATLSTIKNKYDGKMYLSQGKKVTLTINGKTYTATAGKNGAIKFNIGSTTKKGTYKVTIKYAGDGTYEAGTSKTITIKLS